MNIEEMFSPDGFMNSDIEFYFDPEFGGVEPKVLEFATENLTKFPADSHLAGMYYADKFASETHGNYSAETLFRRSL